MPTATIATLMGRHALAAVEDLDVRLVARRSTCSRIKPCGTE
jgi:hypothetical protein